MLKLEQALLVEGKYDAARLSNIVDGTILTTDGFRVFKDGALQRLLKRIAAAQGLIILTDSDAAGFKIRHFVTGLVGAEHVLQAYVPAIAGKESRKAEPGKEGLLGVEGVSDDLIVQGLETALASKTACQQKTTQSRSITYTDLYDWGISGTANSAENRRVFLRRLGLPEPCKWFRAFLYASNAIRLPVFLILPSTAYCRRRWACASRRGGTA